MSTMDFWTVFKRPISVCPGFARWIMPKFVKNQKDSLCRFAALLHRQANELLVATVTQLG